MANSLLDFVMALVRDPDAAAQYAAHPAQAIADAHLTDVTSADVDHLIPVVAESMSTVTPSPGVSDGNGTFLDPAHNVWASGAATAAFDAFDDHLPIRGSDVVADQVPAMANVIELPEEATRTIVDHDFGDAGVPTIATPSDPGLTLDTPVLDELHVPEVDSVGVGHRDVVDATDDLHGHPHDPGFDVFR